MLVAAIHWALSAFAVAASIAFSLRLDAADTKTGREAFVVKGSKS
jgi:hypothetical protein